ncbi:uracil-DNA glycosylase family protein [Rubripirellula reticaptiva]|nr:uracil-DNA glycosylase family protein [Rubripirellula reticaptiva]
MKSTSHGARKKLIAAARKLCKEVDAMSFGDPVTHVYNPLNYAWDAHKAYLSLANDDGSRVVLLGMNPGPWGMAQTGIPFGEIAAAKDWLGIDLPVHRPAHEHPKRPVEGFACSRSEVSGRRLWGLFAERFPTSQDFFRDHFVVNYCPLVFMESSAKNRTPNKLPASERAELDAACDRHLASVLKALHPEIVIGVGAYAEECLKRVLATGCHEAKLGRILHPSPASPAANKDWAGTVTKQLTEAGVWD